MAGNGPIALAADGRLLAFGSSANGGDCVTVYDLDRFVSVRDYRLPSMPEQCLAWSVDGERLACVCEEAGDRFIFILDKTSGEAIRLPRPVGGDLPDGIFAWSVSSEFTFFPTAEPPLTLDLETLVLTPHKPAVLPAGPAFEEPALPKGSRWRFGTGIGLTASMPPNRREPSSAWSLRGGSFCAFGSSEHPVQRLLTGLPLKEGCKILCSDDGAKIILVEGGKATVAYMKIAQRPARIIEAAMPMPRSAITDSQSADDISKGRVCAFVHSPLKNPLNGRTIGPDYAQSVALLRLVRWQDDKATFVVASATAEIASSDVIATLHTWSEGKMTAWPRAENGGWWTLVGNVPDNHSLESFASALREQLETPQALAVRRLGFMHVASKPPPLPQKTVIGADDVKSFVESHHHKASEGDLDGVIADYADSVDFLDKGVIPRGRIADEEIAHKQKWPTGNETVRGGIAAVMEDGIWKAYYTIEFYNENAEGWHRGLADLRIELAQAMGKLKISSQKAKVHDLRQGAPGGVSQRAEGPSAVTAIKIRLPGPVWAGRTSRPFGTEVLSVDDAVHLRGVIAKIHRTYRVFVGPQTPRDVAAQFPAGLISMQTAEIDGTVHETGPGSFDIYCGIQGWSQEPDASFGEWNKECAREAQRIVGTGTPFRFSGNDLIATDSGATSS